MSSHQVTRLKVTLTSVAAPAKRTLVHRSVTCDTHVNVTCIPREYILSHSQPSHQILPPHQRQGTTISSQYCGFNSSLHAQQQMEHICEAVGAQLCTGGGTQARCIRAWHHFAPFFHCILSYSQDGDPLRCTSGEKHSTGPGVDEEGRAVARVQHGRVT